jgi:hypothetical protein
MTFRNGYSAKVALTLKVAGHELPLSHVGPKEVSLRAFAGPIEPSNAQVVIQVDGSTDVMDVYLPHGIRCDAYEVAYL